MAEVEMVIDALRQSSVNHQWVVILKDKLEERYLPVYIGSAQAETIKRELIDVSTPRPLDNDLIYREIFTKCSEVKVVKLHKFEDNRFYAKLVLAAPGKSHEVDCPVAKALAIAVRVRASIFADQAMLNKAAITVPV